MKKRILAVMVVVILASAATWILGRRDTIKAPQTAPVVARFWQKVDNNKVLCQLCPHECTVAIGRRGLCRVRKNDGGRLYTLVHGKPVAIGVGPIEKAPFHHFVPGHKRLTIATAGCNFKCKHCQNWSLSQRDFEEIRYLNQSPREIVARVKMAGLNSVSFTYTEPTIFFEYMYDIAKLARANGIKTTIVTNGFINPEPLKAILKHIDAVRVDLKAFCEDFYRQISGASLKPVLTTLKIVQEQGVWLEIINLVIPTLNDCPDDIRAMCEWILKNLGADVPIHFNRFHPAFQMTHLPPTPVKTLEMAYQIAQDVGLNFASIGNVPGHPGDNTFCPDCGKKLIHRAGLAVLANNIKDGKCRFCKRDIPGVWSQ